MFNYLYCRLGLGRCWSWFCQTSKLVFSVIQKPLLSCPSMHRWKSSSPASYLQNDIIPFFQGCDQWSYCSAAEDGMLCLSMLSPHTGNDMAECRRAQSKPYWGMWGLKPSPVALLFVILYSYSFLSYNSDILCFLYKNIILCYLFSMLYNNVH